MGGLSRIQEVDPIIRNQRPVVVLSGAVNSGKRLFMEQALEPVLIGGLFQGLHDKLIVIHRHVALRIDGGKLMLTGSNLIVLCLGGHTELPQFLVHILHKIGNPFPDNPEVMIVKLLSLGRHGTEEGTPGKNQILALQVLFPIHQEIFLFGSYGGRYSPGGFISKEAQKTKGLPVNGLHGAQKRRFLIQSLSFIGAKSRRYVQNGSGAVRILFYKGRRGTVPGRIPPCLKGSP